ncbi:MAG: hypothetical protein ACREBH_01395 [Candidatus Micrarchaeaceae archaeon]
MPKQQAALEFIMAYAWAIMIITLFIVSVLLLSDTRPPSAYLQYSCNIQPLLPCTDSLMTYNSIAHSSNYYIVFTNQLGSSLDFPANAINISIETNSGSSIASYSYGACSPGTASPDATVLCNVTMNNKLITPGTTDTINFVLSYYICGTANTLSCAPGLYKSSGYSIQGVGGSSVKLDYLTFNANSGGTIVINGVTYFSGTSAYFQSGNYFIYAQPAAGSGFQSWAVNSPSSVASASSRNTTLVLKSSATLTGKFT